MKTLNKKLAGNQKGFASLIIAIVLVLVLSLLTVGFAQLTRKEQRSALDKQLSSQAYYAAETGINDATKAINAGFTGKKDTCGPLTPSGPSDPARFLSDNTVKSTGGGNATGATYPCLLINPYPKQIDFSAVSDSQSKVVELTGVDPDNPSTLVPIFSLHISWQDASGGHNFVASGHSFGQATWPYTGVLRVSLTPLASGHISRSDFINNSYIAFLYPNGPTSDPAGSYPATATGDATGEILNGNCESPKPSEPHDCNVTLTQLGQANYLLALRSIYSSTSVSIKAYASDGRQLGIANAQTVVDSTGQAQDEKQRVQAKIPTHNNYPDPVGAVDSVNSICKQLQLTPSSNDGPACTP